MILWKIAIRNLFRHRIRTALNVVMIVGGFTAIILFLGFAKRIFNAIEVANVKSVYGHIQIGKQVFWDRTPVDREIERLIEKPDQMIEKLKQIPLVKYASSRLTFFALLSSGDKTTSGQGWGLDPQVEVDFVESIPIASGQNFSNKNDFEILLGTGLQAQMQLKIGETVTLLGQTVDGAANAIDADLVGVFQTGVSEIDNTTFIVTMKAARKLIDTDAAERVLLMLNSGEDLDRAVTLARETLAAQPEIQVKAWKSLSRLYQQTVEYFKVQNTVINLILGALVLLGIINTIGMSIYEQTQEIGTCRALGDRRADLMRQFCYEGLVLFFGSLIVALPFCQLMIVLINSSQFLLDIPGATLKIPIEIHPYFGAYVQALVVVFLSTMIATIIPAWNASKIPIVEALRK